MVILLEDTSRQVSPTEFERMAGKESSKKWKATIRILRDNGAFPIGSGATHVPSEASGVFRHPPSLPSHL